MKRDMLIKGLEIPEDGYLDVRILGRGGLNAVTWNDLGCYPYAEAHDVVVLPEKYGRLIDESIVLEMIRKSMGIKDLSFLYNAEKSVVNEIYHAPTVIEAEGE